MESGPDLTGKIKVVDIGIDSTRIIRSSSYIVERITMWLWKNRNLWKWLYHLDFKKGAIKYEKS